MKGQQTLIIRSADPAVDRPRICAMLAALPGVADVRHDGSAYALEYDVLAIGAAEIIESLRAAGGQPEFTLIERLRLQLRCYRDAIRRDEQMNELGWDSFVREIYVSRYRHRRHGRRDDRPRNWRHYAQRKPN